MGDEGVPYGHLVEVGQRPEQHEITADEMDKAIKSADFRKGDEVLIRTGWGTRERAYELGIDYYKRTKIFPIMHVLVIKKDE